MVLIKSKQNAVQTRLYPTRVPSTECTHTTPQLTRFVSLILSISSGKMLKSIKLILAIYQVILVYKAYFKN